ncbi:MAG: fumarate hydratase [Treponema sp.]|nr:fumarate hydratase [Treponema sp.]
MKEVNVSSITDLVSRLCMEANFNLNRDIEAALTGCMAREESPAGKSVIASMLENSNIAREEQAPICQDTGMAVVFFEIGTDVHITGGDPTKAINEGVKNGYQKGYLRKSVVRDPIDRVNTNDNTPAIIHYLITAGDQIKITVAPKGFGSENMSAVKMLTPSEGIAGIKRFVVDTVSKAGANPCPPIIVGVGAGGTFEKCALLSKQALLRPVGSSNPDSFWGGVEKELLEKINALGIGPAGFGGRITALGVNIETFPTHIAGLPVAVNIGCHVTRHAEGVL